MKLLQVYNQYRSMFNGEEGVIAAIASLLEEHGHTAKLWMQSSRGLEKQLRSKLYAFYSGIYSRRSYREMQRMLREEHPDIVHAHNLYPLLSPSVLVACRRAGVPVVMTFHNHGITCPRSDHLYRGEICEKCRGGKEINCVLKNCRENIFESIAYATRAAVARRRRWFQGNVNVVIALTDFAKLRLLEQGFSDDQVEVLPNMFSKPWPAATPHEGKYVAFAGRLSAEKGIDTLLAAAVTMPDCPIRLAGDGPLRETLQANAPPNVVFDGRIAREEMATLYRDARFVVVPSRCFEMCPLVISEAMSHGIPVIASRIGGLAEMVQDGVTGLLFDPNDADDLRRKMRTLWEAPEQCRRMGAAAHERAKQSDEIAYYKRLMNIYENANRRAGRGASLLETEPQSAEELVTA